MSTRVIRFGIIGCGLMGREFASAAARWCHLVDSRAQPRIVAACDLNPALTAWFAERCEARFRACLARESGSPP